MCFGSSQTTSTTTPTANPAVANAATQNLTAAEGLQTAGFTPYSGQQVASLAPAQQSTIDAGQSIANNGTGAAATGLINSYASAPAQSVSANSIASNMSPYMNQYVMQALAPQLQQMNNQEAATEQSTNAQATGSGAFGDARTGIQQAQNQFNNQVAQEGVIGNAYNSAFNTAIGAGAQDSANQLSAANANAGYAETALGRQLGGAQALEGLQTQQEGTQTAANTLAQQDTAQQQAQLTAQYNQWLMAQQYPFLTSQNLTSATQAGAAAMPASTSTVSSQPNNSGWAMLGAIGGGLLGNAGLGASVGNSLFGTSVNTPSDRDLKKDIAQIGKLLDGTPVYSYSYFDEDIPRIGLMAQDVEKRRPDAVVEMWPGGAKAVDYGKATALSRALAMAA